MSYTSDDTAIGNLIAFVGAERQGLVVAGAQFEQVKPHVNIGTIGAVDDGKSTLTAAISKVLADKYPSAVNVVRDDSSVDIAPQTTRGGMKITISHVEYETPRRHYAHVDAPDHADFTKNMVTEGSRMDGAILVVAATDGPMARTREQLLLAKQVGVTHLLVALNKSDMVDDEEILELVELEVRELLNSVGYDGDKTPIVRVSDLKALEGDSAWTQKILDLMEAVDESIPDPVPDEDKPFLMPIEDVFTIAGRGTVVTGRAERGTLPVDSEVEIVGLRPTQKMIVTGIEMFHKQLDEAWAGETYGLLLRGADAEGVERGQVIVQPGSVTPHAHFESTAYILAEDEGGRRTPFFTNYRPQFYFRTTDVTGIITLPEGTEMVMPGDTIDMTVELARPIAMEEGLGFAIRQSGRTVGAGTVTKIIQNEPTGASKTSALGDVGDSSESVTVWYGTNRLPKQGSPATGFRNGKGDTILHLGKCVVQIPESHQFGSVGTPLWRKLWTGDFRQDRKLKLEEISPAESVEAFAGDLREVLGKDAHRNRALVYVHGYNTSFKDAAIRAAQITADINPPGVTAFFSWPSHADPLKYQGDSQRAQVSEDYFIDFLQILVDQAGVERIDLLIHSMGNQVFARSVQRMLLAAATKHIRFGVIILAAPDIDTALFKQIAPQYCSAADKATMYVSTKDLALKLSTFLQQGPRAGYGKPVTVVTGIDTVEVSRIDFSALGHGYYAEAETVMCDMKLLIEGHHEPQRRMRLIAKKTAVGEDYWRFRG